LPVPWLIDARKGQFIQLNPSKSELFQITGLFKNQFGQNGELVMRKAEEDEEKSPYRKENIRLYHYNDQLVNAV
jgi:hypothetical protein